MTCINDSNSLEVLRLLLGCHDVRLAFLTIGSATTGCISWLTSPTSLQPSLKFEAWEDVCFRVDDDGIQG